MDCSRFSNYTQSELKAFRPKKLVKMKIRKEIFVPILLFLITQFAMGQVPQLILFVGHLARWAISFWRQFNTGIALSEVTPLVQGGAMALATSVLIEGALFKGAESVPELSQQLEAVRRDADQRMKQLTHLITITGIETQISIKLNDLEQQMGDIDDLFDAFKSMMPRRNESVNLHELCTFATEQLSATSGIKKKVSSALNVVFPRRSLQKQLLDKIIENFRLQGINLCGLGYSPHQYLHTIYVGFLVNEIESFIMQAFSHSLLFKYNGTHDKCVYSNENAAARVKGAHGELIRDLRKLNTGFIEKMRDLPRNFRACDQHGGFERDVTFLELEGAIQGILACMDAYPGYVSWHKCRDIDTPYNKIFNWPDWGFHATHPVRSCSGRTFNCVDAGFDVNACLETNGSRRYKWIDRGWRTKSGDRSTGCDNLNHIQGLGGPCKFCLCDCNDNDVESSGTHIFNLQAVESDVVDNMVITGIRFIVQYKILQFQIQQGKLGINWEVTDVHWKPINDISDEVRRARLGRPVPKGSDVVKENVDFLILKKWENNAINLDTLHVPHGHLLTGVKFSMSEGGSHKRIAISLIATKFDYITGKLCTDCQKIIIESEMTHDRELNYNKKNAYNPSFPTLPKSEPGQFITIDSSDRGTDAGQATLPYFDAVPVESSPPSPLGGAGLFYKTKDDFAGLISMELISVDYTKYMEDSERDLDEIIEANEDDEE